MPASPALLASPAEPLPQSFLRIALEIDSGADTTQRIRLLAESATALASSAAKKGPVTLTSYICTYEYIKNCLILGVRPGFALFALTNLLGL